MTVHNQLGSGFQEVIYQRALGVEFRLNEISFVREQEMLIGYKGYKIGTRRVDFFVEDKISVELKAISTLDNSHIAQALNYLEAFNLEIGLLINFGQSNLNFRRFHNKKYDPNYYISEDDESKNILVPKSKIHGDSFKQ